MESMLVEQQYMRPPMRPFELEMASSSLTLEEKAILQARMQLLGFRSPFPSPPGMSHSMSQHLQNQMNHLNSMNMSVGSGFPPFGPGGPGTNPSSAQSSRMSDVANALNLNGSLSQLYAMAAASSNNSGHTSSHHLNSRGGPSNSGGGGASSPNNPSSSGPQGPHSPQVPLPIQLWTQWASLHGLAPTLLAHHAQLAAAMAAASSNQPPPPQQPTSSNQHHPYQTTSPISNPMSNGSANGSRSGSPPGNNVSNSSNDSPPSLRLPRPFYPGNSPSIGPTTTTPLSGIHRFSPYNIPMNNLSSRSNHGYPSGGNNKSPSPLGSPDSARDEVIS